MKVQINSRKRILKSFLGWLPLALAALVFYGVLFMFLVMWFLANVAGFEEALARQASWVVGASILTISVYAYLRWLTSSLSSYWLSIESDKLRVRGKNGWRSLDAEVSVDAIEKIYLGQSSDVTEKLASGHGAIRDQADSRLTFFPKSGEPFNLDFAAKAFDNRSLYEFLMLAKKKGIETNVSG